MNKVPTGSGKIGTLAPIIDPITAIHRRRDHARDGGGTKVGHSKQAVAAPVGFADESLSKPKAAGDLGVGGTRKSARRLSAELTKEVEALKNLRIQMVIWFQNGKSETPKSLAAVLGCMRPKSSDYWNDVLRVWKGPAVLTVEELGWAYEQKLEKTATQRVQCLNRGVALVAEAAAWRAAKIGPSSSDLSTVRGKQWRLAAAWAGIELLADTFFPREFLAQKVDFQTEWCVRLGLEELRVPVAVPRFFEMERELADFWDTEVGLQEFLGVRSGRTWSALDRWWLQKQPVTTMSWLLNAVRCLRDLTTHGLLSASRAKEFGLADDNKHACILDQMLIEIVRVASASVRVVLKDVRQRHLQNLKR